MTTAPPLSGYHHLGITVSDVEASEAWYARTLGLVRAFTEAHAGTDPDNGGYAIVMTRPGTGFFIGLDHHVEADKLPFDPRRTGLDHVALAASSAEEVHAWAAYLDSIGVEHGPVIEGNDPMPNAAVHMVDPDGVPIELMWVGH
jgi:glyoxylase I family protein